MSTKLLILLLPALASAYITIGLTGENQNLRVIYSGSVDNVITDEEVGTFRLNDNELKDAVDRHFGRRPDDAYLRSPTPWGDLYRKHNWGQVTRTLRPISGRILSVDSQPQIVMKQVSKNDFSEPATFRADISQSVQNTVSTSWNKGGAITVGAEIKYEFLGMGGQTSMSFTGRWGEEHIQQQAVTVGSTSGMEIFLQPGKAVETILQANRGTIQMEVEYEAVLSGSVAVNYGSPHKGHHFWALDVNEVMRAAGYETRKISKEVITVGFFSDAHVYTQNLN